MLTYDILSTKNFRNLLENFKDLSVLARHNSLVM